MHFNVPLRKEAFDDATTTEAAHHGAGGRGLYRVDGILRQETKESMFPPLSIPPGDIRPPIGVD